MSKSRKFQPLVAESGLEERVVMSVTAARVNTTPFLVSGTVHQTVTNAEVQTTLNQIHQALLSYQRSVTNALLYAESQITAGNLTANAAVSPLEYYIGNKTSQLFYQVRAASGNLPYGAGFNGYLNTTTNSVSDLPGGSDSLYALLTYPSTGANGPIVTLQNNIFTALSGGNDVSGNNAPDYAGAVNAVNSAAIHSTYQQVKAVVAGYVSSGRSGGLFR